MMAACRTYLAACLATLRVPGGHGAPYVAENVFFDELPRDWLKDHDYAVCCLPLQDRSKPGGRLIGKTRSLAPTPLYTLQRRRFRREIIFRCLMYAPAGDLWGLAGETGLADQFQQAVANRKIIAASDNSAIKIEPQDAARPWSTDMELDRKLRRPRLAIVRVLFTGGIQTTTTLPIVTAIELTPVIGPIDSEVVMRDSAGRAMTDSTGEIMTDSRGWNPGARRKYVLTDEAGDIRRDSTGQIITDSEEQ